MSLVSILKRCDTQIALASALLTYSAWFWGVQITHIHNAVEIALMIAAEAMLLIRMEAKKSAAGISYKMVLLQIIAYLLMLPYYGFKKEICTRIEYWVKLAVSCALLVQMRIRFPMTIQHKYDRFPMKRVLQATVAVMAICIAYFRNYEGLNWFVVLERTMSSTHLYIGSFCIPCQTYMFVQMAKSYDVTVDTLMSRYVVLTTIRRLLATICASYFIQNFGALYVLYSASQVLLTSDFVVKYLEVYKQGKEAFVLQI